MFDFKKADSQTGEDFLKHAAAGSDAGVALPLSKIADTCGIGALQRRRLLAALERDGYLTPLGEDWALTEAGWRRGRELIRAHRLYESYLAESTSLPPSQWHEAADQQEHHLDAETVAQLAVALNRPRFDPHGDAIPTSRLEMEERTGTLLSKIDEDGYYRIVHLEDEPPAQFKRSIAMGLAPELILYVEVLHAGRYRAQWAGHSEVLDSEQAAACSVQACEVDPASLPCGTLLDLPVGEAATIHSISPGVRGLQRRRLLDLGFVPGSRVSKEGTAAFGGPMRFRVRGTTQALRPDVAAAIYTIESGDCSS